MAGAMLLGLLALSPNTAGPAAIHGPVSTLVPQPEERVPYTPVAPMIDGVIGVGEWAGALMLDISDTLGVDGVPNSPGDCLFYAMHDEEYLYIAFQCFKDWVAADHSQASFCVDDDDSGDWPPEDTSEGMNAAATDNGWLCAWFLQDFTSGGWYDSGLYTYSIGNAQGYVICEWALPLVDPASDSGPQFLGAVVDSTADTLGVHIYYWDDGEPGNIIAYWPQDLPVWYDPAGYGRFILEPPVGQTEAKTAPDLQLRVPAVCRGAVRLSLLLPEAGALDARIYDASGRLVSILARGNMSPGSHSLASGELEPGAYILWIRTEGVSLRKTLMVR